MCKAVSNSTSGSSLRDLEHDLLSVRPSAKIVLITPESLTKCQTLKNCFKSLHLRKMLRFVIDEAHCITECGHSYRKDYLDLANIKQTYNRVQICAFTATATLETQDSIIQLLKLDDCDIFRQEVFGDNINFSVVHKTKKKQVFDAILNLLSTTFHGVCGIIYCTRTIDVKDLAYQLSNTANPANVTVYYSNELGDIERHEGLSSWLNGDSDVLVATKSAGLGLDKSDLKFVIDADMPNSLEELSQHAGRAGRNRQISSTYLLFIEKKINLSM